MEQSKPKSPVRCDPEEDAFPVKGLPSIDRYMKLFGKSCGGDDRKGAKLFKEYEGSEQLQRLIRELHSVRNNKASDALCERVIGKARKARFESYSRWALMMIGAVNKRD